MSHLLHANSTITLTSEYDLPENLPGLSSLGRQTGSGSSAGWAEVLAEIDKQLEAMVREVPRSPSKTISSSWSFMDGENRRCQRVQLRVHAMVQPAEVVEEGRPDA